VKKALWISFLVWLVCSPTWAAPELLLQVGHFAEVTAVAVSPDGRSLASYDHHGNVKLWDVDERRVHGESAAVALELERLHAQRTVRARAQRRAPPLAPASIARAHGEEESLVDDETRLAEGDHLSGAVATEAVDAREKALAPDTDE